MIKGAGSSSKIACLRATALGLGGSLALGVGGVQAQASRGDLDEVVVTASRVAREGFTAPTPLAVVGKEEFLLSGSTSVGAALTYMPQTRASTSPSTTAQSAGNLGFSVADLRGLGPARTLVLIDGQRPVLTTATSFDLNVIPVSMIERVEVVTGGASAGWGSDAVAGVVNVITDSRLQGQRASVQFGAPFGRSDGRTYAADFALGFKFGPDDRGHVILGGEYTEANAVKDRLSNEAFRYSFISNPAYTATNGQPQQILVRDAFYTTASQGGLISSGPLAGTAFGAGGVPYAFQYGQFRTASTMAGGDPLATSISYDSDIRTPVTGKSLMARGRYALTDAVTVTAKALYSRSESEAGLLPQASGVVLGALTIRAGNPFIPASVRTAMTQNNLASFQMGRSNSDFGILTAKVNVESIQGGLGLEGRFDAGATTWRWNLHGSYGESRYRQILSPQIVSDRFAESVDAVTNPATGQPVCRVALTNPTTACVPVNLFGLGSPSPQALAYFLADSELRTKLTHRDIAGSIQGEPFSTWAGPVSIVLGGEYRREAVNSRPDALSVAGRFAVTNNRALAGAYSVTEGFGETVIPLARDLPLLKRLDFNGAVRLSHYNLAGDRTTWKLGFTNDLTDELRVRATRSRDLRAPNLQELYTVQRVAFSNVLNPFNNQTSLVTQTTGGNTQLDPEVAHTTTAGIVYQPRWASGLKVSLDWYDIDIKGGITTLSAAQIVNNCFRGQSEVCGLITPTPAQSPTATITAVQSTTINAAAIKTSGADLEVLYRLDLSEALPQLPGELTSHLTVSYVDRFETITGPVITRGTPLAPRWQGTLTEAYRTERLTAHARARLVGALVFSNTVTNDANHIPDRLYIDVGAQYALDAARHWVAYGNITNLFDKDTPLGAVQPSAAAYYYDQVGRSYNVGLKVSF